MLNRTRRLYRKLLSPPKSESSIDETIATAQQFKVLKQTQAWKRIDKWMDKQVDGMHAYMEWETRSPNIFSFVSLFNTFVKYLFLLHEKRAYTKLRQYVDRTIERGESYAAKRAKQDEQNTGKQG